MVAKRFRLGQNKGVNHLILYKDSFISAQQPFAADATSSVFCEVALCTLRLSVSGGFLGAAETEALGGWLRLERI
jgi:hypothetical protein